MSTTTTRLVAPLAVLALSPLLAWCGRAPETPAPEVPTPPAPTVVLDSALNRAAILAALNEAGSALADGRAIEAPLTGRTVSVRLPFGCEGPDAATAPGQPRLIRNPDQTLTLSVTPEDLMGTAFASTATPGAAEPWDAVEGFWIPRPWSRADACAVTPAPAGSAPIASAPTAPVADAAAPEKDATDAGAPNAGPPPPLERTAGLAAVFETGGSRLGRRPGQAYAHVIRGDRKTPPAPAAAGYALRLEGRLIAFTDGRAIHCRQTSPDQRPSCIAALRLDRLAFEDGATGAVLSEWRPH